MAIPLRDYQIECLETVLREYKAGINRQLVTLPTGSGKTVVMSAIAHQLNKKTLILAHREELINQAVEKFRLFWPEVSIGICKAERNEIHHQVVVGSVQSCSRSHRLSQLKQQNFGLLMVDEAHHAAADTYQNIVESLGFTAEGPGLLVGVTATPQRTDKLGLDSIFDKMVFNRSIATMIKAGYLSPVVGRKILTNLILDKIRIRNGDFAVDDLAEAVNTEERNAFIVDRFKTYAPSRKAVAFCVDVQHCQDLADAFKLQGIASEAVWGDMKTEDRQRVLNGLKNGIIQVATSCGVLTEGFDEPSIDAIVMARPTKSAGLYIQCVGRGLRLWPGKEDCLVLDFTDKGHNLDSIATLSSSIPEALHLEDRTRAAQEDVDKAPKIEVLEEVDREFDILGAARFSWVKLDGGEWSLLDDHKQEIVISPQGSGFIATLHTPEGKKRAIVKTPLPLEYCSGVCEDFARQHLKIAFADVQAAWMTTPAQPTQGQKDYLQKHGAYREGMSKAEASLEIRRTIAKKNKQRRAMAEEPATPKQLYALKSHGIDGKAMSKLQAMQEIAKIKQSPKEIHG